MLLRRKPVATCWLVSLDSRSTALRGRQQCVSLKGTVSVLHRHDPDAHPVGMVTFSLGETCQSEKDVSSVRHFYHRISSLGTNRSTFRYRTSSFRYFARS